MEMMLAESLRMLAPDRVMWLPVLHGHTIAIQVMNPIRRSCIALMDHLLRRLGNRRIYLDWLMAIPNRSTVAIIAISSVAVSCIYPLYLAWIPAVYFTNESGYRISDVSISISTSSGDETLYFDAMAPGQTISIRKNTSDLIVRSFAGTSNHGAVRFLISENITPTEKLRIGIPPDGSPFRSRSRYW